MINSIRNENDLSKAWGSVCKVDFCGSALEECTEVGCFGKPSCKTCVENYRNTCSRCVDDIYDETSQITLPDNRKTIICDMNNHLHTIVCNFYCWGLFKLNYKCEIISNIPVCNCIDTTTPSTTSTTTISSTRPITTKIPEYPSNMF